MRKLLSFLAILFIAVISSACINSYAVKELNEKANAYMQKGDVKSAIARLESSIDLDNSIYESRYNLAVAYLKVDECSKALEQIEAAKALLKDNSPEPNVYYTAAVANNCLAEQLYKKASDELDDFDSEEKEIPDNMETAQKYSEYLETANSNFEKYIKLSADSSEVEQIQELVKENNSLIQAKKDKFGF